jgi:hypothetical protein
MKQPTHTQRGLGQRGGYIWEVNRIVYSTPIDDFYNETILKEHCLRHNKNVKRHFKFIGDLPVINLKEPGSYQRFCAFLGIEPLHEQFPWLNRSDPD